MKSAKYEIAEEVDSATGRIVSTFVNLETDLFVHSEVMQVVNLKVYSLIYSGVYNEVYSESIKIKE